MDHLFFRYENGKAAQKIDRSTLQSNSCQGGKFMATGKGGKKMIVEGWFNRVDDSEGRPLRYVLIGSNVTEIQTAMEESNERRARMETARSAMLDALSVVLNELSEGNLSANLHDAFAPEYEPLRQNFNTAIGHLNTAMKTVIETAEMIGTEAADISTAADHLSIRTERQAATLEETAASLDELNSSVKSAANGATRACQMADTAKQSAEKSEAVVRETVAAMSAIEQSSKDISKIINVIEDIAFQTNLLALNAGVEAARAGEAGRGFAVVASEVRALAQRSSSAAQEINDLIRKSGTQVEHGVGLVDHMGNALQQIVTSVSEISTHITGIASSVQVQSGSLEGINQAMSQLDRVTQQNAAMFQETTAASHSLTRQVQSLSDTTQMFRLADDATHQAVRDASVHVSARRA